MNSNELKKRVRAWAKEVGYQRARVELVSRGVGLSTTEKLLSGTYKPTPRERIAEALEAAIGHAS